MKDEMKSTLISVLHERMDKCTSEQFWASSTLTALNGFLLLNKCTIEKIAPTWLLLMIVAIATGYGVYFIIHRHVSYYRLENSATSLLSNEPDVPYPFNARTNPTQLESLTGVAFYVSWVAALFSLNVVYYGS
jgi:phosphate/sulfate permease